MLQTPTQPEQGGPRSHWSGLKHQFGEDGNIASRSSRRSGTSQNYFPFAKVQIRPWNLSDSDFVMDGSQPLDPRKTIFVGGVPRPLRAGNAPLQIRAFARTPADRVEQSGRRQVTNTDLVLKFDVVAAGPAGPKV